jgi:energy-coupling factor transporter ATP-binding protein EcfA2
MEIELRGFRSHSHSCWEFDLGESNYIRGDNGCGKSDIYRAITWAIYGENTKNVYQAGNKTTVVVKLRYKDVFIRRQANSECLSVTIRGIKLQGLEAQAALIDYFGSSERWRLASYVTQNAVGHAFVTATPEERMYCIHRLISHDEGIKTKIEQVLKQAKMDVVVQQKLYAKATAAFDAKFGSYNVNKKHRRSPERVEAIQHHLTQLQSQLVDVRVELNHKESLLREVTNIRKRLVDLDSYTTEVYDQLKTKHALYQEHAVAYAAFKKYDTQFGRTPAVYTLQDYDDAVVASAEYKRQKALAHSVGVEYSTEGITTECQQLEQGLEYAESLTLAATYRKQSKAVRKLQQRLSVASKFLGTTTAADYIRCQEENMTHIRDFELLKQYRRLEAQLQPNVLTPDEIKKLSKMIEEQWILDRHDAYTALRSRLPDTINLPEWRQELQDAENSRKVLICPGCQLAVCHQGQQLLPYEGRVVRNVNLTELRQRIALAEQLQSPPELPPGLVRVNIPSARQQIDASRKQAVLLDQLQSLSLPIIPEHVQEIENVPLVQQRLTKARQVLELEDKLRQSLHTLSLLPNPSIPDTAIVLGDIDAARNTLDILSRIQVVAMPTDSEVIRKSLEWHRLRSLIPSNVEKVKASTVESYHNRLIEKQLTHDKDVELTTTIQAIAVTEADFTAAATELKELEVELQRALDYNKLTAARDALALEEKEVVTKKKLVANIKEFRTIYLESTKKVIDSTLYTIRLKVNSILNKLLQQDITIDLVEHNGKLKLHYFKKGVNHGDPREMSGGEGSVLTFACILVFNQLTNSKILILDEATEGLTPNRKDDCMRYLVDYTETFKRTLLLTDHSCHTGDYHNIIDVDK